MKQLIRISLCKMAFELEQDGYNALSAYLDQAKTRLQGSPDQQEIVADLERSIAEKLAGLTASQTSPISRENIVSILTEVGAVETGEIERLVANAELAPKWRQLYRIKQRQHIAGVCAGLAEYSDLDANWVRCLFLALTLLTGGLFAFVYIAMMFIVPVAPASTLLKGAPGGAKISTVLSPAVPAMGAPPGLQGR